MVRLFGPTPSQIWRFPERSIQVVTANWLVPTDRWFQPWAWTIGRLYTSGECEGLTAADDDGLTGNYTTETETLSRDYFTGIIGKGRLTALAIHARAFRCYGDTATGTYYYRMYIQPFQLSFDGTMTLLGDELLVAEYSVNPAWGEPGWSNVVIYASYGNSALNVAFDGILGLRLRMTCWTTGSGTIGHGIARQNDQMYWGIAYRVVLD